MKRYTLDQLIQLRIAVIKCRENLPHGFKNTQPKIECLIQSLILEINEEIKSGKFGIEIHE